MENGMISRQSSSTSIQQTSHHYLPILMSNGKTMSGPMFSLLGSDASPKAPEEKSIDIKKEPPAPNSLSKTMHQEKAKSTPKAFDRKDHIKNTPKEKEVSIPNQPHKSTTPNTLSTQREPVSTPTSKPTSKTASTPTPTPMEEDEEDEDLSDFEGSDLSDLTSGSSGSEDLESDSSLDEDEDNSSNKDSEEASSDDEPKRTKKKSVSGSKTRVKNRRIQSDSSSDDDRPVIIKRKPGRPPKSKSNPESPTFHRSKKGLSEDAEMEDVVSPTTSEAPRRKGKQPDFTNIGKRDRSGRTQLFKYTAMGDLETCRQLIEAGAQVNDRDNAKWTPLHEACVTGHAKVAELLIQHHAEVNAQGGQQDTPLHDAAQNGHVDVVKLLLANGANVLAKNKHGVIPIDVADDKEVIDLLQRRQQQVNMLTGKNQAGQTLLHRSCSSGSYNNVVDLVNQGADINAQDNAQWTPLHEAALAGHTKVVEFLLSRGADPNAMGHGDDTALHDASQNEHEDVVKLLLEYGADPDLKNSNGEKPCDVCEDDDILDLLKSGIKATKKPIVPVVSPSSSGSSLSSLSSHSSKTSTPAPTQFLGHKKSDSGKLSRRKEGSDMSDDGRSASEDRPTQGQMSRDERKMQQLLSTIRMQEQMEERKKAKKRRPKQASDDEDMEDNKSNDRPSSTSTSWKSSSLAKRDSHSSRHSTGNTRRRSSRSVGHDESGSEAEKGRGRRSVQRSQGDRFRIDHRYKDSAGRTQLHQWAEAGDLEMVGTLLEGGADRNPVDQDGVTPLHLAAKAGNTEVLTLLLAYGCNINTQDHDKATALHEAVRHHHTDAVRMLLQNNARLSLRDSRKRMCLDLASSKDTEIKALLKQALEQAEKNSKEKSKKRVSQVMDAHNLPKTKERKTSRLSDSDESGRPTKSKPKDKTEDRKSTITKSISMPSISVPQPLAPSSSNPSKSTTTAATTTAATAAAATTITTTTTTTTTATSKPSWTGERDESVIPPKKKLHSRKSSSGMADDDMDMQSGSSKKRRDIDRPADPFGGKVKIKKEREDDSPFRPQGITAKTEELRRVASTPYLKDSTGSHRPASSKPLLSSPKPGSQEGRPNSLPSMGPTSSSVASMSPPLTEASSSSTSPPPPAQPLPQVSSFQEQELSLSKSRKRNSQTFSSPSGYLKFADDLKLGSMTTTHSRNASTTRTPPAPPTETEVSRKKAKTTLESVSSETKPESKEPKSKETPPTPLPSAGSDVSPPTSFESNRPHGRQVAPPEPSPAPEIKQEPIEVKPSMRSVQDAQRYLPLYTVQLSGDVEETTTTTTTTTTNTNTNTNSKYVTSNGTQHFCVVDRQVQLLLGLRPGSLFLRYPHLYRRMVTKREKVRLWSPLSSMVSDRCAAAVKFNYEILPAECHPFSTTTAMSRLKEHEKQKFLGCDLYFIRLEEVIEVIKKDYGQLNESMMTITLDIGYDEAEMEVDDDEEEGAKGVVKTEITVSSTETLKATEAPLKPIKKEGDGEERAPSEPTIISKTPQQRPVLPTPNATAPNNGGGYIHKLRRVPAKMATKAMFKEMQLSQYRAD